MTDQSKTKIFLPLSDVRVDRLILHLTQLNLSGFLDTATIGKDYKFYKEKEGKTIFDLYNFEVFLHMYNSSYGEQEGAQKVTFFSNEGITASFP